jgi:2-polyprenyl-3-methyl-5-hydroxy-6-metoxy-1,4-benzoquinol methylase
MITEDIEKIIHHIVSQSTILKNKYTNETNARVEFCDIFCDEDTEYLQLTEVIKKMGKIVYAVPTGKIYSLYKPIDTVAGKLRLVKIRKPDVKLRFRGDADFNTDYPKLKRQYQNHPNFELIIRERFEMLRLSDPDFDVMTCFSNIPVKKWLFRDRALSAKNDYQKWLLWDESLRNGRASLRETLIRENMDYLRWQREKVLAYWGEKGTQKIKEKWERENPRTEQEIAHYYDTLELYIPELSSWHAMEKNIDFIKIVEFLQFAVKENLTQYLDFGAGIGSNGLLFSRNDFNVTLADISGAMINYAKWRLKRHGAPARFIDLKIQGLPFEYFDCATAIEVLEHAVDPVALMKKITDSLKRGGYVFVTTPFYHDPERPQHIVNDISIAREFEKIGLRLISDKNDDLYRVYKKI